MYKIVWLTTLAISGLAASMPSNAHRPGISGDYVEVRSCDVYTGPCFANAEMNLTGQEAVLTWSIREGQWDGARLDGLKIVAVVRAQGTLGDVRHDPQPARSVLVVDENASPEQQQALVNFARHKGGELLGQVVRVEASPIEVVVHPPTCKASGCALVRASHLIEVKTRCLGGNDHVCGNEECYYPPLVKIDDARPAFTEVGLFRGQGLGITFDEAGRRSAYLGTFSE